MNAFCLVYMDGVGMFSAVLKSRIQRNSRQSDWEPQEIQDRFYKLCLRSVLILVLGLDLRLDGSA